MILEGHRINYVCVSERVWVPIHAYSRKVPTYFCVCVCVPSRLICHKTSVARLFFVSARGGIQLDKASAVVCVMVAYKRRDHPDQRTYFPPSLRVLVGERKRR